MMAMRLASTPLLMSSAGRMAMANGHRSFHYFSGRMNGSPSHIFKSIGFSEARHMYNNEIRPLIEPTWGQQNGCFKSVKTRAFLTGYCAALDFIPLLGTVSRWSKVSAPDAVSPSVGDVAQTPMQPQVSPSETMMDLTQFITSQFSNGPCPTLNAVSENDLRRALSSLLGRPTGDMGHHVASENQEQFGSALPVLASLFPPISYHPEAQTARQLHAFFTTLLTSCRPDMTCQAEYRCYQGWDHGCGRPRIRGVADLAVRVHCDGLGQVIPIAPSNDKGHAIVSMVCELKSDATINSACAAFVQVMQYMVTDTVINHLESHQSQSPGVVPWTVAMIGTGVANFQMFAISLPVLKRIRHHLDEYSMPESKLPVLVLSSASSLPVLPPNQVLISHADPFMGPKQLVDFVQLASWIGSPVSQWAGVGGACEAKVRRVLDEGSAV